MHRGQTAELRVPAEAASVPRARTWARRVLDGFDDDCTEVAVLLLSEVVTNAVLHARSDVVVRVLTVDGTARVEVADASPAPPVEKRFGDDAATGRGLQLLAAMATAWGVEADGPGKRVWFEVAPGADTRGAPEVTMPARPTKAIGPVGGELLTLSVLALPVAEYLHVEAHNDALIREFSLIAGGRVAPDLAAEAEEFTARFGAATTPVRDQVQAAVDAGETTVDIVLQVPHAAVPWLLDLAARLDEADQWADEGRLLTVGGSARVRRFRDWYTGQLRSQAAGAPPTPWPYGDDDAAWAGP